MTRNNIPCSACGGSGIDTQHNWKDGDIASSRIDIQAACERCEGSGIEPTPAELEALALWAANDSRLAIDEGGN